MNMESAVQKFSPVQDLELFATSADQMKVAQEHLIAWCDHQVVEILVEKRECEENIAIATKNKWRTSGLKSLLTRIDRRITFYDKIREALKMGFVIIPDFPVDVFAVRTTRSKPHPHERGNWGSAPDVRPSAAPQGEGAYVSEIPVEYQYTRKDKDGKDVRYHRTEGFDSPQFPVSAVKPHILQATEKAMGMKLFDQMGVVMPRRSAQRRGRDPIVIGKIMDPRSTQYSQRYVSFFVAWWFDTRDLR